MTWVWNHSRSRNGARLVLLAIADAASDDGTNAWPSVKTLKVKANLSERSVQNAIQELEKIGELKVDWNKGPHGSNRYTVLMRTPAESAPPKDLHPADSAGVESGAEAGTTPQDPPQNLHPAESAPPQISTSTPADSAPKPSLNHPSSSSSKKTRSSPSAKGTSGTRIPDDFALTAEMIAWGKTKFPAFDGEAETENFIDYWRGRAGAAAEKVDWIATWRNWIRRAAKDAGSRASPGRAANKPATGDLRRAQGNDAAASLKARIAAGEHIPNLTALAPSPMAAIDFGPVFREIES
jgi:hypothetical protein